MEQWGATGRKPVANGPLAKVLVMVDDSHAVGFAGPGGRGTPEQRRDEERESGYCRAHVQLLHEVKN
jgi:hypothetical protein